MDIREVEDEDEVKSMIAADELVRALSHVDGTRFTHL